MKTRLVYKIVHAQAPAILTREFENPFIPQHCSIGHVTSHMGHVTGWIDIDDIVVL